MQFKIHHGKQVIRCLIDSNIQASLTSLLPGISPRTTCLCLKSNCKSTRTLMQQMLNYKLQNSSVPLSISIKKAKERYPYLVRPKDKSYFRKALISSQDRLFFFPWMTWTPYHSLFQLCSTSFDPKRLMFDIKPFYGFYLNVWRVFPRKYTLNLGSINHTVQLDFTHSHVCESCPLLSRTGVSIGNISI